MIRGSQRRSSLRQRLTWGLLIAFLVYELLRRILDRWLPEWVARSDLNPGFAVALTVLFSIGMTLAIAYFFSDRLARLTTDRLEFLADAMRPTPKSDELPGPFDATGDDEVARIAAGINAMRRSVEEQTKDFGLQDIRRREWIAQVSHDLRTPLTAQSACLDRAITLLEESDGEFSREQLVQMLQVARMDGERVHTLADDLLEIARLDAGDRLQREPVPPGELVRQAVRGLEPLASQKGLEINVHVTAHLPELDADGRRLMRAIENLIRNAIQHANSEVWVYALMSEPWLRFEVRDDGRGLPKDKAFVDSLRRKSKGVRLKELAERRSRADSAGLGLIVAQRVAEAHGGSVDAYNLSTGGAAFHLDLPLSGPPG